MAPFPVRRGASSNSTTSILPTSHSVMSSSSGASYPPALVASPSSSAVPSRINSPTPQVSPRVMSANTRNTNELYGHVDLPTSGCLGSGLPGRTHSSRKLVRELVQDNHDNHHTFFNDDGFHNHAAHHLLASYSLGAGPKVLKQIYQFHSREQSKPMLPHQPIVINESNWVEFLGDEQYYPNFLSFFTRLINTRPGPQTPYSDRKTSVVPVVEKYLLGGYGQMLIRSISGAIHGLINIGYGLEFGLTALVAEGLAQSAVTSPQVAALFPSAWPPAPLPAASLASTISSVFRFGGSSSAKKQAALNPFPFLWTEPIAEPTDNFANMAAKLNRERRTPRNGLSGFMILDRILHDSELAAGRAVTLDDFPKLGAVIDRQGDRIVRWCEEWKFAGDGYSQHDWDDEGEEIERTRRARDSRDSWAAIEGGAVPEWDEIVEKTEELMWMATVIYASASRPGYETTKLDFFNMHALTSVLFLPPILQAVSPHLRPYLLHSHFRIMIGYWVSRGRPDLHISDTLMAATAFPRPSQAPGPRPETAIGSMLSEMKIRHDQDDSPDSPKTPRAAKHAKLPFSESRDNEGARDDDDEDEGENPWPRILASAADHPDDHLAKVIRSLAFAASHFGHSPQGFYSTSLPGTELMDGTIFVRAAGLTMKAMGWAHEGEQASKWDRSCLGFDEAWEKETRLPGYEGKGKLSASRTRSGTETEETYLNANSPATTSRSGWYQSSTPERVRSPPPSGTASGTSSTMSTPPQETRLSFSDRDAAGGHDEEANVGTPRGAGGNSARLQDLDDDDTVGSYRPEGVDYDELRRRRIEEENERELMA